ncbi:MAG TPA: hypothetical protein VK618_06515 [Flavitalea sp.]|nr:hypothetical protein [Flavitalea sp.]
MKKILICLTVVFGLLAGSQHVDAQDLTGSEYKSAVGIRLGGGYYDVVAGSLKTFITKAGAIELNLGVRGDRGFGYNWVNLSVSGSYQHHFDIPAVDGLKWFIGGGLTAYNSFSKYDAYDGFGLSIFPTGGADYKFENIPLNVSVDVRPSIQIVRPFDDIYNGFYIGNFGAAVRYTFR